MTVRSVKTRIVFSPRIIADRSALKSRKVKPTPSIDCVVRLSASVNSKAGPATSAALKVLLRAELLRLFASQRVTERGPAP